MPAETDVAVCRATAAFYRARGYNPLPSRMDEKRPMLKYADLWDAPLAADDFDRFTTANLQVMCGRRWKLLAIDLDGPEATERWKTMGRCPRTWISHSGGGGWHVWFTIVRDGKPLPKAILWKGDGEHSAIERLCDKSLVMAPPSIHPKTGRRYVWLDRWNSPNSVPLPAACPEWVLNLAPVAAELAKPEPLPAQIVRRIDSRGRGSRPTRPWREVVESIDVPNLVRSWGIRTVGQPRQSGWLSCHAFDRDDARPSAAIHATSGFYVDSGTGLRLRLPDLAVALHIYATPQDAITDLGDRHGRCG